MTSSSIVLGIENIFCGVLFIEISIPLFMGKIKMNRLYGIRFHKSFESQECWYKINRYGAKRIVIWSIPIMIIGIIALFVPLQGRGLKEILFALAPCLILIAVIESYLYARRL